MSFTLYVVSKSVLYGAYKTLLYPGVIKCTPEIMEGQARGKFILHPMERHRVLEA